MASKVTDSLETRASTSCGDRISGSTAVGINRTTYSSFVPPLLPNILTPYAMAPLPEGLSACHERSVVNELVSRNAPAGAWNDRTSPPCVAGKKCEPEVESLASWVSGEHASRVPPHSVGGFMGCK